MAALPQAARPFVSFAALLRRNGFAVVPEQTQSFVAAVGLLGPRAMDDIFRAALATLAPPPERRREFDALYRAHFLGQSVAAAAAPDPDEDEDTAYEALDGEEVTEPDELNETGAEAASVEALGARTLAASHSDTLRRFARAAPKQLPRRLSRRLRPSPRGRRIDLRRALRAAVAHDGELITLPAVARRQRQRRILFLVDVSGSMKAHTDDALRLAHALARSVERTETFTIGTRLTRITRAMRRREQGQALAAASSSVKDWDGGTRLGDALSAFLAIPRFAGFARSATIIVVSDGLERDDPATLVNAVRRLARLAHAIVWLTPLAAGPAFRPETDALSRIAPEVTFGSAADLPRMARDLLVLSSASRRRTRAA